VLINVRPLDAESRIFFWLERLSKLPDSRVISNHRNQVLVKATK